MTFAQPSSPLDAAREFARRALHPPRPGLAAGLARLSGLDPTRCALAAEHASEIREKVIPSQPSVFRKEPVGASGDVKVSNVSNQTINKENQYDYEEPFH